MGNDNKIRYQEREISKLKDEIKSLKMQISILKSENKRLKYDNDILEKNNNILASEMDENIKNYSSKLNELDHLLWGCNGALESFNMMKIDFSNRVHNLLEGYVEFKKGAD